jgi:hypothetical protein
LETREVQFAETIDLLEKAIDDVAKEADVAEKEEASAARVRAEDRAKCEITCNHLAKRARGFPLLCRVSLVSSVFSSLH